MEVALVRYGEIGLKSRRVRSWMERILRRNIEKMSGGKTLKQGPRILVLGGDWEALGRTFGVVSWSPAVEVRADLEEIKEKALELYTGGSFRITTQRITKDFPMTSLEINREVGAYIVERMGAKVDLKNPDVDIGVEIIGKKAYLFTEKKKGPGGLPVGVEGDAVLLFSGGIDSPVAGWMIGRRGVRIHPFHLELGVNPEPVLKRLNRWFPYEFKLKRVKIDREEVKRVLEREKRTSYIFLVMKALMYRRAEEYAEDIGADALITGETIGQVSSQTLRNLRVLDTMVNMLVLRPLVGMDKEEVVKMAKEIGTYEESIKIPEPCAKIPYKPTVRADPEVLRELVEKVEG
jgi:thiamine biosynthesis protein ThiI